MDNNYIHLKLNSVLDENEVSNLRIFNPTISISKMLDSNQVIDLIVLSTPLLIPILKSIILKKIEAKQLISFKYGEIEIKGLNKNEISDLLTQIELNKSTSLQMKNDDTSITQINGSSQHGI